MSELHPPFNNRITTYSAPLPIAAIPTREDEIQQGRDFREYLRIVGRHWKVVLLSVAVCFAAAVYKANTDPAQYRSTAVIQVSDARAQLTGGLSSVLAGEAMGNPIKSQLEILRSRTVLGKVVDDQGMRLRSFSPELPPRMLAVSAVPPETPAGGVALTFDDTGVTARFNDATDQAVYGDTLDVGGVRFAISERPEIDELMLVVMDRQDAVRELQYRLGTSLREGTDIVDVGLTLDDPEQAQRVTNAVVERFRSFSAGQEQQDASRRRAFLQEQLASADSALRVAQVALTDFRTREQVFSSRDRYLAQQTELLGVRRELSELEGEQRTYEALLTSLRPGVNNSGQINTVLAVPGVVSSPVIAGLFSQLQNYQTSRDTMTVGRWGRAATDPDVQRVDSLVSVTQQRLRSALQSQLRAMDVTMTSLRQEEARAASALQGSPQTEAEEVRLVAEASQMGEVVAELREKYQQAKVEEAVQVGKVAVIDPALPGERLATTRIATMVMGLIFGLALGGGIALVLESSNTALRRRDGLEDLLQVPELAVVPRGRHAPRYGTSLPIPVSNGNGRANSGITEKALGTLLEPRSPFADAFRGLYQGVAFSQSVQHLRTLMVTSTAPGEGKSTIAANLAVAAAQAGKRVLLVDADFRRATQHKVFGVPREPGLTHHLLGLNTLDEVVRETRVPGLYLLPAGILPPNPPELLGGDALRDVLHELGQQYDLVVVDTAPLASTGDALALARSTDGVILAVRVGRTDREAARGSVRVLSMAGARVLGAVVSDPGAGWRNGRSAEALEAVEV